MPPARQSAFASILEHQYSADSGKCIAHIQCRRQGVRALSGPSPIQPCLLLGTARCTDSSTWEYRSASGSRHSSTGKPYKVRPNSIDTLPPHSSEAYAAPHNRCNPSLCVNFYAVELSCGIIATMIDDFTVTDIHFLNSPHFSFR